MKLEDYKLSNWDGKKVKRKKQLDDRQILLLSLKGLSPKNGSRNLLAIDADDNILWVAELPTEYYDSYVEMRFEKNIVRAESSNSFVAEIDLKSGILLRKYMVK